jgi:hypothetical protein
MIACLAVAAPLIAQGVRDTFAYAPPSDPLLAKAIAANIDFQQALPNFVRQQRITRSKSLNLGMHWEQNDVVEAEILTVGENVQYRNVTINGISAGPDGSAGIRGAWSVGQYDAQVSHIFNPSSRTQFTRQGDAQLGDRTSVIYSYKIEEEYSAWKIQVGGQTANPAHHGKVWVDSDTGGALRVQTEATRLPPDFPLSNVVGVMQYSEVEIGGRSYLLPARAENKFCERGTPRCTRLDIEFRDYREFSSEPTLLTTDADTESGDKATEETRDASAYVPPADPLLVKAMEANVEFQQELPDFVCLERMKRSSSENLGKKWKHDDVVEAEILTLRGKAQFGEIKIDGKPTGTSDISRLGGAWSFGEFDGVVASLFNPRSRAQFAKQGSAQLGEHEALIYNYNVEEEYSRWTVSVGGRATIPAYHGKVWIDTETGRVLRVETEANYLPDDFPLSRVSGMLQYGKVEINGRTYLLPARAESSSCERGSDFCTRLEIEFLDYRKFSSESSLFTTDSDIEFGREVPDQSVRDPSKKR